jgi:hypothetical protein
MLRLWAVVLILALVVGLSIRFYNWISPRIRLWLAIRRALASMPFGDGSDGDLIVKSGQTVQLWRDMNFRNVTIEKHGALDYNGYHMRVRGRFLDGTQQIVLGGGSGVTLEN